MKTVFSRTFAECQNNELKKIHTAMPKSKEFISSESDTDSDSEPKPKKKKTEKKEEKKPEKTESPKKSSGGAEKGPGGEMMFQLARMRYATVSEFRGKVMVGIREYYEKDGEMRPGKKGISLPMDQWKRLKDQIDDIDQAVKDMS
ncbi:activated RNA polymerase II transcriptional coactivator p15-like isoform X2 [Mercenaria mercenaria]|uniref:activated RNA polymerase II transcriptional coactivator p15-like isoform X2 n=1 Tax=Mercenaria mercenaria TaxID=6596 RepID=UPI00234F8C53|nr:activated RNA polymerase II transcriptional coactivator p15-like isoform X2 [Mercenaria mercenaria]